MLIFHCDFFLSICLFWFLPGMCLIIKCLFFREWSAAVKNWTMRSSVLLECGPHQPRIWTRPSSARAEFSSNRQLFLLLLKRSASPVCTSSRLKISCSVWTQFRRHLYHHRLRHPNIRLFCRRSRDDNKVEGQSTCTRWITADKLSDTFERFIALWTFAKSF